MTKTHEQIIQAVLDYFRTWFDDDVARFGSALHGGAVMRPDIQIQDVFQDIASVRVRTPHHHEYLHLVRSGGHWTIANVLWRVR